jgi:hypothetical protein
MNVKNLVLTSLAVGIMPLSVIIFSFAQSSSTNIGSPVTQMLTVSERALVDGSKKAIIGTGLSPDYFNAHFKLLKVVDKASDRRVTWRFSLNGHDAIINDSIGYYTEGTKRVYVHSVATTLGQTSEIQRTLSRARALKIMKACIGDFSGPYVEYGPVDGHAQLLLVASARDPRNESRAPREADRDRQRDEREKRKAAATGVDTIESEEEEKDRPKVVFGSVNLQTGKCTKGAGLIAP